MKRPNLEPVSLEEVANIFQNLKISSPGHDELTPIILRLCFPTITDPLVHTLRHFFTERLFPTELKIAYVLPSYEADDNMVFDNYRPVSLLCILSKVFEKVMYSRLSSFLERNKILLNNEFGFRKHHSADMALMILHDKMVKALKKCDNVNGIYWDISKAFDTVDHGTLLLKLDNYVAKGSV